MTAHTIDARAIANTLDVTTLDLATFLHKEAYDCMTRAAQIASNEPWYSHEDAPSRLAELDDLVARAKRLMQAAFDCDRAFVEDNEDEETEA